MKARTAWVPVHYFNLPTGTQPGDQQNIKRVEAMVEALTGAESVTVRLNKTASGVELPDQYAIDLVMPAKVGEFVSIERIEDLIKTATITPDQANALADVIKGLAAGKDITESLDRLKAPATGDQAGQDGMVKDDPASGQEAAPPARPPAGGGAPPPGPPRRPPVASVGSCAKVLAKETGLPEKDARMHIMRIRASKDIDEAIAMLSSGEQGVSIVKAASKEPYSRKDYETMCRIAWGLPYKGSADRRPLGQGGASPLTAGMQTDEAVREITQAYNLRPEEAADIVEFVISKVGDDPEESRVQPSDPTLAGRVPLAVGA